jgi:hypothetical protein
MDRNEVTDLSQNVARLINERTWGRIGRLGVEVSDGRLVVHGCARSYYLKQLAIQACLEALGPAAPAPLEVDIEVSGTAPLVAH